MAATIPQGATLLLGSWADGETYAGKALRYGANAATVVGGVAKLGKRGGIIPAQGNPGEVTVTSATSVTIKACQIVVASANNVGAHVMTLTTDTVIDTITSDPTNPRIDVLVAEVICDDATGAGTSCQIKRVVGTAAASPVRPSTTTGLPTNGQYQEIAQIRVNAAGAGLVVTKAAGIDGVLTVSPGGVVPVSSYTEALAELPPFNPFITPDLIPWTMGVTSAACYVTSPFIRVANAFSSGSGSNTTDGNGEGGFAWGVPVNGVLTPQSFPNGCLGAFISDASGAFDEPLDFKVISLSASGGSFRVYRQTANPGTRFTGANLSVSILGFGY
jgi:hypothetical protein